jgi:hypothetical protein
MPDMTREQWTSFLPVRVVSQTHSGSDDKPPLLGFYRLEGDVIQFEPRFPLEPGVRYRAEFDPSRLHALAQTLLARPAVTGQKPSSVAKLAADFYLPAKPVQATTKVIEVYPTATVLPENLLRIYIHFSAPMSRGEAYRRIKLLDAAGKPVVAPFLELGEELWTNDGKRFTLLFDPGRIKRGLKPREELGPILEAGKSYSLVIDRGWPDAMGSPLQVEFRRTFRAGPTDETSPDPSGWKIELPDVNTKNPLELHFAEALDRGLLDRLLTVQTARRQEVPGRVSVGDRETTWRFTPESPWQAGNYNLVIGTELEDVAGNSVASPFEVDLVRPISRQVMSETTILPFRVGSGPP